MLPRRTFAASGHRPLIIVDKPSAYAELYDFIGAINVSQAIACTVLIPTDRKNHGMKDVKKHVVNQWIINALAPAINGLGIHNMYLICNNSRAHNKMNMMRALRDGKCTSVSDI